MTLGLNTLFAIEPFLYLEVNGAQKNGDGYWVADYTIDGANFITIDAETNYGVPVIWAIASPNAVPVGATNLMNTLQFCVPTNNAANVVNVANTITITATAGGIVQTVDIVLKPVVTALNVVANHYAFQDAVGSYALNLTGIAPDPGQYTANLEVTTAPNNRSAWSHVIWAATLGEAGYALVAIDAQHKGIPLDGVRNIRTTVGMLDTVQVMPLPVVVDVRMSAVNAVLANNLIVGLHQFDFAGAGYFGVTAEDTTVGAANPFNSLYPARWDRVHTNFPEAYGANNAIATNGVTLNVIQQPNAGPTNITVRASAYFVLENNNIVVRSAATAPAVAVANGALVGANVVLGNIALGNVPNEVMHNNPLLIFWEISTDAGATWAPLQVTANTVYVTARAPVATTHPNLNRAGARVYTYDSFLAISCDAARGVAGGAGTVDIVRDSIALAFVPGANGVNPRMVLLKRGHGGVTAPLVYWRPGEVNIADQLFEMFSMTNRNVACGAWAKTMLVMWALHGKGDGLFTHVYPNRPNLPPGPPVVANIVNNSSFLVRNWSYNNLNAVDNTNYTHDEKDPIDAGNVKADVVGSNEASPVNSGVAGQNNQNPPPAFQSHFIVKEGGANNFFDPSYGTMNLTRNAWSDASLAGLLNFDTDRVGYVTHDNNLANNIKANPNAVALLTRNVNVYAWVP